MRNPNPDCTRKPQRRFAAILIALWLTALLLAVPAAFAQDATATPEPTPAAGESDAGDEAAEDEAGSASETETAEAGDEAESEAAPLPGVTLLIFGIGVSIVIGTGSAMLFREAAERRAGRTPSL